MYSEKEAAEIILQVMSAVEYCHNNGICHRDLKPENLLYLKKGDEKDNPLKVIDFGLSRDLNIKKILSSKVGTAYYVSPEILAGKYNEKCDIWSSGVILYVLLSGDPPFNGPSDGAIYSKIKKMKFNFPPSKWSKISEEAKDLLSHMLAPEKERYNASQVLAHPWFKIVKERQLEKLNFNSEFLKEYTKSNQLKKIVLLYIASRLSESEINNLKEVFKAFDKDNDGQINYNEFKEGLKTSKCDKLNDGEINSYFTSIDTDKNGKIDYTEFLAATLEQKTFLKEERLYEAFAMLDLDHNGKITKDEIMSVLKLEPKEDKFVKELIKNADKNDDGVIDYKEFLEFMGLKK
jgi:calcium-dependent protein kinase